MPLEQVLKQILQLLHNHISKKNFCPSSAIFLNCKLTHLFGLVWHLNESFQSLTCGIISIFEIDCLLCHFIPKELIQLYTLIKISVAFQATIKVSPALLNTFFLHFLLFETFWYVPIFHNKKKNGCRHIKTWNRI